MRELLPELENWMQAGERVALATVISTWGSAPRPPGSFMAVNEKGQIVGSVSGGCVEGAVIEAAQKSLKAGKAELLHFGVADETAWDVGLACGGEIDIFVQPLEQAVLDALLPAIKAECLVNVATRINGDAHAMGAQVVSGNGDLLYAGAELSAEVLAEGGLAPRVRKVGEDEYFFNPIAPSPTLVMVGGVHIAIALAQMARGAHFRTVIVDPRRAFGTVERFGEADQLIQDWPAKAFEQVKLTSNTAMASLSHDPKIDDPALMEALESEAFYVGALGSRSTHERRLKRLAESGVSEETLARIHSPIGLEIGAQTPEEIAVAILAQVIAAYRGIAESGS